MLFRSKAVLLGLATLWLGGFTSHAYTLVEDFSSDPFATWSFGIGDNSNAQYAWNPAAPSEFTGDPVGSLSVHFDSSLPTARWQRPLGITVSDTDSFTLATRFSFTLTSAPTNQFMQFSFGLINSSTTGGDRTGSFLDFNSDNVFSTVEFNYFPNITTFTAPPSGRTLSPAAFGAQKGGGQAFDNFASIFGDDSNLSDNTVGITELPQAVNLEAILDYNGGTKVLSLILHQINPDGSLLLLNTEVPSLDLVAAGYDPSFPFVVDSLAILAYQDGFTSEMNPSLVADLTFQRFAFVTPVPEPASAVLIVCGLLALRGRGRTLS